jgi:adenosylcobinamide-GDP ribazoletransferase
MRSLAAALSFLTRLPVGRMAHFDAGDVERSAGWFPLIGMLLGAIGGGAAALLREHLPAVIVAVLLIALDALLTGALHFDGLADTADGFGGGKDRDDILRIMRDHSIGSYGGTALILMIALKAAAYAALLQREHWFPALVLTAALSRWSMLLLTAALPYARKTASVIQGMGKGSLVLGTLTVACALGACQLWRAWAAAAAVLIVTVFFGLYCRRRIAGITGDTLGASLQISECAALLAFLWSGRA